MDRKYRRSLVLALLGLFVAGSLVAEDDSLKPRIAIAPLEYPVGDVAGKAAGRAVSETVALTLRLLGTYRIENPPGLEGLRESAALRAFASANRLDAIVVGAVRRDDSEAFILTLRLFDRATGGFNIDRTGTAAGALDIFEATDILSRDFLDAVTGQHLGYGALSLINEGEAGRYEVRVDGQSLGFDISELPRLLNGRHAVSVHQERLFGTVEITRLEGTVLEDQTLELRFALPYLLPVEKDKLDGLLSTLRQGPDNPQSLDFDPARDELLALLQSTPWSPRLAELRAEAERISAKVASERERLSVATLVVTSEPAGSEVLIDGKPAGLTPLRIETNHLGGHAISIRPRDSRFELLYGQSLNLEGGAETRVNYVLRRRTAPVWFEETYGYPRGARVSLDGKPFGVAPFTKASLAYGDYRLEVDAPNYEHYAADISWRGRTLVDMNVVLVPIYRTLPRAAIRFDGGLSSWAGIPPALETKPGYFLGSTDYGPSHIYLCRDDRAIYWRVDFAKTNPLLRQPPGTTGSIEVEFSSETPDRGRVLFYVSTRPGGGHGSFVNLEDRKKSTVGLPATGFSYELSGRSLVGRIDLATFRSYFTGALRSDLRVGVMVQGRWLSLLDLGPMFFDYSR